jgi:enolase
MTIDFLRAYEILDSRGRPTVEVLLRLKSGIEVTASVPSGASKGSGEALELRDANPDRFNGMGAMRAVYHINSLIAPILEGQVCDVVAIDELLVTLDGTPNKERLGANAILPVSMAVARAQAKIHGMPLYGLIQQLLGVEEISLPFCLFNILNGGLHAKSGLAVQEFMIVPRKFETVGELLSIATDVYESLRTELVLKGHCTTVGDEGGFAPIFADDGFDKERRALDLLVSAIHKAGYNFDSVSLALDVAVSQFYNKKSMRYEFYGTSYDHEALISLYDELARGYPIISIEDGMHEDDEPGWVALTKALGEDLQLVGDDVFVSHAERIQSGVDKGIANAVLIKPNQVGTLTETLAAIAVGQEHQYSVIVSHRSGETNDDFIVDLAVGSNAGQLKAGAPVRGERVAKYNRMLAIEREQVMER